jgi:hypothetical protein
VITELERIWKEVIVACSRYHPKICLEGLRNTTTKNSVRTACADGDANQVPFEYELESYRYTNLFSKYEF